MAASVQLNVNVNEQQVRASLTNIQQQIDQMVQRPYTIQINTQFSPQGMQNINNILNVTNSIRSNSNVTIHFNTQNDNRVINNLNQIDNSINTINRNTERLNAGTVALGNVMYRVWGQAAKYFRQALTEMKAVDTELVTIQKVTGETAEGMKRYADDAYEVAARLGAGASEYLNAVGEFAKAGYLDKSKELGELAIMTAKVGDTTQETANQFLLSVDAAYKYHGSIEKLTAVLDGANEVGNRFPTSVQKIAEGLGKVSPIAAQAHVGIDELSAAIGTITAVTQRSGTEAATALRALYLNIIGDTKTEIEDGAKWTAGEIEGLRDVLRKYAPDVVKAAEATQSVINPMEAIAALSKAMKDGFLTEAQLMEEVTDIGGKLRSSQLLALIQNYDIYLEQLETFRDSAGSAAQEFGIYMESWQVKTNQLANEWTKFVQKQLSSKQIKDFLDLLIEIVGNFENWVPLVVSLGAAVAALNLPTLITRVMTLARTMGGIPGILGGIIIAVGLIDSAINQHVANLQKAASESVKNAQKEQDEVSAMMELAAQYATAAENSDDFKTASEKMKTALSNEGIEVNNLTEDYKALMIAKAQAAAVDATAAFGKAGPALEAAYSANMRKVAVPSLTAKDRSNSFLSSVAARLEASEAVFGGGDASGSYEYYLSPTDTSAAGISAYYEAIVTAMREIETENYRLISTGQDSALLQSNYYKGLSNAVDILGESYSTYATARDQANEADKTAQNIGAFYEYMDTLKSGKLTERQLEVYIKSIKNSNVLTETQKSLLLSMAGSVYPQFAEALGLVTDAYEEQAEAAAGAAEAAEEARTALGRYQKAMEGADKDDQFKSYKSVYDEVMKAAKRGAYGSNAFQYGIQALLDPETLKKYEGNWTALAAHIEKELGGLYKDSDSMGRGLLDKIEKSGKNVSKSLYEIREKNGELLASYDKKSGEWYISDKPEDITKLAGKLGMSAESLVAAGIALGAMDPTADVTGLTTALETLLGGGEGEKDALTLAGESIQEGGEKIATAGGELSQAAADLSAAAKALNERGEDAKEANGGVPGSGSGADGFSLSQTGPKGPAAQKPSEYTAAQLRAAGIPAANAYDAAVAVAELEDYKAAQRLLQKKRTAAASTTRGVSTDMHALDVGYSEWYSRYHPYSPGAGALDSANERMAAWMQSRYGSAVSGGDTTIIDGEGNVTVVSGSKSGNKGKIATIADKLSGRQIGSVTASWNAIDEAASNAGIGLGTPNPKRSSKIATFLDRLFGGASIGEAAAATERSGGFSLSQPGPKGPAAQKESDRINRWIDEAASTAPYGVPSYKGTANEQFENWLDEYSNMPPVGIEVDTEGAEESIAAVSEEIDAMTEADHPVHVEAETEEAEASIAAVGAAVDALPDSHVINIDINVTRHGLMGGGAMLGGWEANARPMGDENFAGGLALVNDQAGGWNPELIVANGRAFIANGGDPTVLHLPRGARIFNADETRDIFAGGADLLNLPAFSSGRESTPYTQKKASKKSANAPSSILTGDGSGTGSFGDDMLKKLNEYMQQILDAAEDALNDQLEAINAQIYALKYQTEAAEKASALEEARLELLEAEKNLLDANTERTVRYYNAATGQWEWMADQREVLRAQEELADAQKNLLEAEYDALTTAWKELKDEIEKALEGESGEIDIDAILAALGASKAGGSLAGLQSLISDIFGYTDDPRSYANFDGGGVAHGIGWMPKGNRGSEIVLDSELTSAILNPQTNAAFTGFTDSLVSLFRMAGGGGTLPTAKGFGNVSNLYGGNTYIEGVKIGSDMMNRPLSEVLSTLNLYKNN